MRVGVVGAGNMGRIHAKCYSKLPEVEIVGIVSKTGDKAKALSKELEVPLIGSYERLLKDHTVDAIDICTPTASHRRLAVAALKAKKDVFCEVPIALTVEDAGFMLRAAKDNGRLLLAGMLMRSVSPNKIVREAVVSGTLGRPLAIYSARLTPPYWEGDPIEHFRQFGEPVIDLLIHDFDLLTWMLGHLPTTVSGTGTLGRSGAIEHAFVNLHYRGVHALVEGSAMMPKSWPFTTVTRVVCEHGAYCIRIRLLKGSPEITLTFYPREGAPTNAKFEPKDPYLEECTHFARCVDGKKKPGDLDGEAAVDSLRIALAAGQALKTDKAMMMTPHPGRRGLVAPYIPGTARRR